jgi:hypothetical protein
VWSLPEADDQLHGLARPDIPAVVLSPRASAYGVRFLPLRMAARMSPSLESTHKRWYEDKLALVAMMSATTFLVS